MMKYNYDVNRVVVDGTKAMTKKEVFAYLAKAISEDANAEALVAFLDHEIDLLNKERKPSQKALDEKATRVQKATELVGLLTNDPQTLDDLAAKMDTTSQKVTALFRLLTEGVDYAKEKVKVSTVDANGKKKNTTKMAYTAVQLDD